MHVFLSTILTDLIILTNISKSGRTKKIKTLTRKVCDKVDNLLKTTTTTTKTRRHMLPSVYVIRTDLIMPTKKSVATNKDDYNITRRKMDNLDRRACFSVSKSCAMFLSYVQTKATVSFKSLTCGRPTVGTFLHYSTLRW